MSWLDFGIGLGIGLCLSPIIRILITGGLDGLRNGILESDEQLKERTK